MTADVMTGKNITITDATAALRQMGLSPPQRQRLTLRLKRPSPHTIITTHMPADVMTGTVTTAAAKADVTTEETITTTNMTADVTTEETINMCTTNITADITKPSPLQI